MNKLKISILSLSLLTVMAGAAVAPALGTIAGQFHDAPSTLIKLIITIPALMIIMTSGFFSFLIARISPKHITLAGLVLYIVGGTCAGFMNNIYMLLFCRVLLGIGVGLIMPLSTGFLTMLFDQKEQAKLMGYSSAMNNLGGIIATSLSGVLVAINWRLSFAIYGLGLVVLVLIVTNLSHVHMGESGHEKAKPLEKKELMSILPYAFVVFWVMVIFYALPSNFSMIVSQTGLVPVAAVGLLMSVQNIAAFITGMQLSRLLKWTNTKAAYVAGIALGFGFLMESLLTNVVVTVIGLVGIGLGLGILVPMVNAQIATQFPRHKIASAMSIMSVAIFLGQFLSPIIIDAITASLHMSMVQAPYYIAVAISLILLVLLLVFRIRPVETK